VTTLLKISLLSFFAIISNSVLAEGKTDLRVLIDVSGSMKKNDPNNLRAPALRLLIRLIPKASKSGVWLFEKTTKNLIRHQTVTAQWKKIAIPLARKIHSRGQRTDLELALNKILRDWKSQPGQYNRHLIILSDGMIDVSKSVLKNTQSRQRIISNILPKLRDIGIKVHTIALSRKADHKLLKLLSRQTNGWYESVSNSKNLHRSFLKLFENTTHTDKVPLKNNQFNIDKSISDMTLLVFKDKNSPTTKLTEPNNKTWSDRSKPNNVKWFSEKNYDLITIQKPRAGTWRLHAKYDPDNRVMVVTNLKLKTAPFSQHLLAGDIIKIDTWLEQNNKKINQHNFLRLVNFKIQADGLDNKVLQPNDQGTYGDQHARDGIYYTQVERIVKPGQYTLSVTAKSPTFERMLLKTIRVHSDPVKIHILQLPSAAQSLLQALTAKELFSMNSVKIVISFNDKTQIKLKKNQLGLFEVLIPKKYNGQSAQLYITGLRRNGSKLREKLTYVLPKYNSQSTYTLHTNKKKEMAALAAGKIQKKLTQEKLAAKLITKREAMLVTKKMAAAKKAAALAKQKLAMKNKSKSKKKKRRKRKHKKNKRMIAKVHWGIVTIGVAAANILLIGLGIFFYSRAKRKTKLETNNINLDSGG